MFVCWQVYAKTASVNLIKLAGEVKRAKEEQKKSADHFS